MDSIEVTEIRSKLLEGDNKSSTVAYITFTINGSIVITGARLVSGKKGIFLAMPSKPRKAKDSEDIEWQDICFPCTKPAREILEKAAMKEYDEKRKEAGFIA